MQILQLILQASQIIGQEMLDHLLQTEVWYVFDMQNLEKPALVMLVDKPFAKMQTESPFDESAKCGANNAIFL